MEDGERIALGWRGDGVAANVSFFILPTLFRRRIEPELYIQQNVLGLLAGFGQLC